MTFNIPKLDTISPKQINEIAENAAEKLMQDSVKTSQIRNVYGAITKIRQDFDAEKRYEAIEMDLVLLKPKVAYAAGRQKAVRKNFYPLIKEAVEAVEASHKKDVAVQNFLRLMESVVAYHRFFDPNN